MIIKFCQFSNRYYVLSLGDKEYCSFDMFGVFLSDMVAIGDIHCKLNDVDVISLVDCSDRKHSELMFNGKKIKIGLRLLELTALLKKTIPNYICTPLIRKHDDGVSAYSQILFVYENGVLNHSMVCNKLGLDEISGWSNL